jgi:hypothetical protein
MTNDLVHVTANDVIEDSSAIIAPSTNHAQMTKTPMLTKCGICGEEYWSDEDCPRAKKHDSILSNYRRSL